MQWDELHLKVWSWLNSGPFLGCMHFEVEYDPVRYENQIETIKRIHSFNLQGENSFEGVQKPSQKDHLPLNAAYVGLPT
jgi:hypothetical protein